MGQDHFWNLLAKKLSGEASEEEVKELALLIKTYPELSYAAQQVADIWHLEQPENEAEAEKAFKKHFTRLEGHYSFTHSLVNTEEDLTKVPPSKRKWLFPAFILLLCTGLGTAIFIWSNYKESPANPIAKQTEEIFARPGTRTKLVLPDSSVIWLNAGSKLTYTQPFGIGDRVVTLSGEAFFNVVKSQKPFIIHTSGAQIKVLGTVFNVRNYPNEKKIETSLISGQVEITVDKSPEKKYILKPNEKLTLNTVENNEKDINRKTRLPLAVLSTLHYLDSSTIAETSWIENKLVFADEAFADVAHKMERWFGVRINFKAEALKKERFTGVFEKETVWQALAALQVSTPFEFSIKNDEITITK